jgi:hypothetical protein
MRRAEGEARLRHPPARRRTHGKGDPEIGHHGAAVVQQDVLGLDVPVDHALPMGVIQRVRHVAGDPDGLVDAELRFAIELVTQGLALDVGHDVEEEAVGLPGIEQRQDVRVLERRGGLDLLDEPLGAEDRRELRAQHLDRDPSLVLQVVGEIDRGHPPLAQVAFDAIAAGEGRGEAVRGRDHPGSGWIRQ